VLVSIAVVYEPEALKNVVFQKLLIFRISNSSSIRFSGSAVKDETVESLKSILHWLLVR
jgi:hypothetical protein